MESLKNMFFGLGFVIFVQGCASIGTAIDGGKELVVNTVDTVVGTPHYSTVAKDVQITQQQHLKLVLEL